MHAHTCQIIISGLLLCGATRLSAADWLVGPTRSHNVPSQVSSLARDGDTISIDAGVYAEDVARWSANRLVLRGVGGRAHLKANGKSYGGKAVWVIAGDSATVENI